MNRKTMKKLSEKIITEQNSKPKMMVFGMDVAKKGKDKSVVSTLVKGNDGSYKQIGVREPVYKKKVLATTPNYVKPSSAPSFNRF